MATARYFLPDHPTFTEVYSKSDLRSMLVAGKLSRSDMVLDDETGLAHFLGDLLAMPYPEVTTMPTRSTGSAWPAPIPPNHEFRADTPLPRSFREPPPPDQEDEEDGEEDEEMEDEPENDDEPESTGQEWEDDEDDTPGDAEFEDDDWDGSRHLAAPTPGSTQSFVNEEESTSREPEELLYICHPSWFAYPRSLLAIATAIAGGVLSYQYHFGVEWVMLFGSIAGLVLLFVGLDRHTSTFYITTRRVEMEYGIIGRNTKEVRIQDIRAIDVQQEGWRALLGLGTVKFDSSASTGPEVLFRDVRRPHDIKELVRELQG